MRACARRGTEGVSVTLASAPEEISWTPRATLADLEQFAADGEIVDERLVVIDDELLGEMQRCEPLLAWLRETRSDVRAPAAIQRPQPDRPCQPSPQPTG